MGKLPNRCGRMTQQILNRRTSDFAISMNDIKRTFVFLWVYLKERKNFVVDNPWTRGEIVVHDHVDIGSSENFKKCTNLFRKPYQLTIAQPPYWLTSAAARPPYSRFF